MSSRTAGRNRAIRKAWENEKRLVLEGKGTRDWTPEQQEQIAEKGKAYDDKGRAFEGQHMKSVSAYPEYLDDPRNIQFLSHDEHLAAHGGSWMNQTNGYYDPALRTMSDFGDGPPQPCAEVPLTKPLYPEFLNPASGATTNASTETTNASTSTPSLAAPSSRSSAPAPAAATPKGNLRQWTQSLKRVAQQTWSNPHVRAAVLTTAPVVAKVAIDALGDRSPRGVRATTPSTQSSTRRATAASADALREARRSPDEHGVSGYTRKDGTSVRPYQRGGKKD